MNFPSDPHQGIEPNRFWKEDGMKSLDHTAKPAIAAIGLSAMLWLSAILWLSAMLWLPARASGPVLATQKNRTFQPGAVELAPGETLRILNDDGPLLHHVSIRSERFNFDSGEQKPGATVDIVFPDLGSFTVLCGIHPKMRMTVTVR